MKHVIILSAIVCLLMTNTLSADDNKDDVQGSINGSYQTVKWGKEIDDVEYVKLSLIHI